MKNTAIKCLLILCLINTGCDFTNLGGTVKEKKTDIVAIKIVNHTENKYIKRDTVLTEQKDIASINEQLNKLTPFKNVNGKKEMGYFGLTLVFVDKNELKYDVVYTVYDGVIVYNENSNQTYKDDKLEEIALDFLHKNN